MKSGHENKGTFISSTFKVEENKVPFFFDIMQTWWVMAIFFAYMLMAKHLITNHKKNTKGPYFPYMTSDEKNEYTLFSSTFKVEENKVPLFLWSDANLVSYGYFVVLHRCQTSDHKSQRTQKVHISLIWCLIKKIKTLFILQLQKLK